MVAHFGSATGVASADANNVSHTHTIGTGNSNIAIVGSTNYREGNGDHMIDGTVVWDTAGVAEGLTMLLDDFQTSNANAALSVKAGPTTGASKNVTHTDDGKGLNNWAAFTANFSDVVQADPTNNESSTGAETGSPSHANTTESDTDDQVFGGGYYHNVTGGTCDQTDLLYQVSETEKGGGVGHTASDADTSTTLSWTTNETPARWILAGMLIKHQAAAGALDSHGALLGRSRNRLIWAWRELLDIVKPQPEPIPIDG